jgi:hypothetical protein
MAIDNNNNNNNNNKEGSDPGEIDFLHEFHAIERVKQWVNNNQKNVGDGKLDGVADPFIMAMMETLKIPFLGTAIFFLGDVWHWVDKHLNPKTRLLL